MVGSDLKRVPGDEGPRFITVNSQQDFCNRLLQIRSDDRCFKGSWETKGQCLRFCDRWSQGRIHSSRQVSDNPTFRREQKIPECHCQKLRSLIVLDYFISGLPVTLVQSGNDRIALESGPMHLTTRLSEARGTDV